MCSSFVPVLQQYVKTLKQHNEILFQRCEQNEQYSRRLCVRITTILSKKNESSEDVRNSVKFVIEEPVCDIPDIALDHADRIGKNDPSEKNIKPFIVIYI